MSTTGSYSFSVSRDDIIRQAMLNVGKLSDEDVPTPQETRDCAILLNMMVKQWQGKADFAPGLKTWTRKRGILQLNTTDYKYILGPQGIYWFSDSLITTQSAAFPQSGPGIVLADVTGFHPGGYFGYISPATGLPTWIRITKVYPLVNALDLSPGLTEDITAFSSVFYNPTIPSQPVYIEAVVLRDSNNNDTPINLLTQQAYDSLPSKTSSTNTGDPTAVYIEFQLNNSVLYLDVGKVADITKRLVITYLEASQDLINPLDEFSFPQEWFLALTWGLSEQIAPMFHVEFTPMMMGLLNKSLAIAQKKEAEQGVYYFQPGMDG